MGFDRFEIRIDPAAYVTWPKGGGFQPVELRVNGTGLIELVRDAELTNARAEYDERVVSGENPNEIGGRDSLAGAYAYLSSAYVFPPSKNLLGEPFKHGFVIDSTDARNAKSILLQCTCGITECWFLIATIKVLADEVIWSDFCQFHRTWHYDLGPFRFDRKQYETQLARTGYGRESKNGN